MSHDLNYAETTYYRSSQEGEFSSNWNEAIKYDLGHKEKVGFGHMEKEEKSLNQCGKSTWNIW